MIIFLSTLLVLFTNDIKSQSQRRIGTLPSINVNKKLNDAWELNFKIESRQFLLQEEAGEDDDLQFKYALTDFSILSARKVGLNSKIIGGYLIRIEPDEASHRFIQQFTLVQKIRNYRLAHRLAMDQTINKDEPSEFRFRYRIGMEFSLNGETINNKEFYLKLNNEYLNSIQEAVYDLEVRMIPLIGYNITDTNKLEFGIDYRIDSFIQKNTRNTFWININWYLRI